MLASSDTLSGQSSVDTFLAAQLRRSPENQKNCEHRKMWSCTASVNRSSSPRLLVERMGGGERRLRAIVTRPGGADDLTKRVDLLMVRCMDPNGITVDPDQRAMASMGISHLIYSIAEEPTMHPMGSRTR